MIVVVPNVMGIALFAPPLDKMGNSARGKLIDSFNFHNYDSLLHADSKKHDPRRRIGNRDTEMIVFLLFAAKNGDFDLIRRQVESRMYLQGTNLEMADYDGRTALHIASAEGHLHLVKFFVNVAKVNHQPRDRWGRTPLDDARTFHHEDCIRFLLKQHARGQKVSLPENTPASENESQISSQADESSGEDELSGSTGMMLINEEDMKEKGVTVVSHSFELFYRYIYYERCPITVLISSDLLILVRPKLSANFAREPAGMATTSALMHKELMFRLFVRFYTKYFRLYLLIYDFYTKQFGIRQHN
ncbi:unnamed protein product [Angiostrongylus costaricensis]|uniref:glutaminase n=1 Tax=Angiostrongylus costaricensis TaxID=334426 RepID=A0A0R3PIR7_ANGCS|nr:unnamed protein product [Angiostrongylus costaricensis]